MILPQLMIDIESSRERHVEYDVEVETISGKKQFLLLNYLTSVMKVKYKSK